MAKTLAQLFRMQGTEGNAPRLGSVPPKLKADESVKKSVRLAAGLLDPVQVRDALGLQDEVFVHRLIARKALTAHLAGDVPVVRQSDLDGFVGKGMPDLEPAGTISRVGWFLDADHPVSESEFRRRVGQHAEGLPPVSQQELDRAYRADPSAPGYRFIRTATPSMRAEYEAELGTGTRQGFSFVVSLMRSHARWLAGQGNSVAAHVQATPAWLLYSSADYYDAVMQACSDHVRAYVFSFPVPPPPGFSNKALTLEVSLQSVAGDAQLRRDITDAVTEGF